MLLLEDIQDGATVSGDCGAPDDEMPPWMDRERFDRGRQFFHRHLPGVVLSMYMALLVGLGVDSLLDVLLFTGKFSTPERANKRFLSTARRVWLWHDGDVLDINSKAHASVMKVRNMHNKVARDITKERKGCVSGVKQGAQTNDQVIKHRDHTQRKHMCCKAGMKAGCNGDEVFFSQYDMALTQAGFVLFSVVYPEKFGIRCTTDEIEDYIFFWRGIGYLLGIEDRYNMCSGSYDETLSILKDIENEIVKPGFQNPPQGFEVATTSFVEGVQLGLMTKGTMFSFAHDLFGLPMPKASMGDRCKLAILKCVLWWVEICPGLLCLAIEYLDWFVTRENPVY